MKPNSTMELTMQRFRLWAFATASAVTVAVLAGPATWHTAAATALGHDGGDRATASLLLVVAAGAWLITGWLALLCVLDAIRSAPGRVGAAAQALSARITPRLLTQLLHCGVAAGTGFGVLATALPATAAATPVSCAGAASTFPSLDRPAPVPCPTPSMPVEPLPTAESTGPTATYTVQPGDTLWALAARELAHDRVDAPPSSDTAIAQRWPAWYAANRSVIGADPNLLRPGQVLQLPATGAVTTTR
ncbi:MAG TPA: LysM domain-containing protein [Mycobacteriales bacterium]|jgi:hypothetical protein|nr:LysM domain-containing protein [Mycobacteriales bacterium]